MRARSYLKHHRDRSLDQGHQFQKAKSKAQHRVLVEGAERESGGEMTIIWSSHGGRAEGARARTVKRV